jgi:TusA-related sulfurtransferase
VTSHPDRARDAASGATYDLTVDARGMRCPTPVIELARRIGEVPVGGLVAVLADDEAARHDVPAWCEMRGQEYVGEPVPQTYVVRRLTETPP